MTDKAENEPAPKKTGKKKLIIIAAVATVALLGGGGALAFVLLGKKPDASAQPRVEPRKMPVFVDLETFTVNLKDKEGGDRFLQVKLVAEVKDVAGGDMVKTLMPAVRNEVLLLLGSKAAEDLSTREGKEELARQIVTAANKPLEGTAQAGAVENVNFTHLIVQ